MQIGRALCSHPQKNLPKLPNELPPTEEEFKRAGFGITSAIEHCSPLPHPGKKDET